MVGELGQLHDHGVLGRARGRPVLRRGRAAVQPHGRRGRTGQQGQREPRHGPGGPDPDRGYGHDRRGAGVAPRAGCGTSTTGSRSCCWRCRSSRRACRATAARSRCGSTSSSSPAPASSRRTCSSPRRSRLHAARSAVLHRDGLRAADRRRLPVRTLRQRELRTGRPADVQCVRHDAARDTAQHDQRHVARRPGRRRRILPDDAVGCPRHGALRLHRRQRAAGPGGDEQRGRPGAAWTAPTAISSPHAATRRTTTSTTACPRRTRNRMRAALAASQRCAPVYVNAEAAVYTLRYPPPGAPPPPARARVSLSGTRRGRRSGCAPSPCC